MTEPAENRWERVKQIFEEASACAVPDQRAFLRDACAGDEQLRAEVERLLAHKEAAGDFLERPIGRLPDLTLLSPPSSQVFVPDQVVKGRFRIVCHLATGGMGEVYRATDLELRRDVAVKVLRSRLAHDPDRVSRLRQEGLATARLNHPNIVTLFEIGHDGDVLYIVSELLIGETLRMRLGPNGLPIRLVLRWAHDIARGLEAAHKEGIIHRDLKPDNIFVTQDGRVKLLDFGLAKLLSEADASDGLGQRIDTAPLMAFGTPGYMAPEQAQGHPVDHRADIFAFGVVLYEMLSGHRPKNSHELRSTVHLPGGLRAVLTRCMAPEPEDRFKSTSELLSALDVSPRGFPVHWAIPVAVGLTLAVTAVSLLPTRHLSLWPFNAQPASTSPNGARFKSTLAVLPVINLSGDAHTEQVGVGMTSTIAHNLASIPGITVAGQADTAGYLAGHREASSILNDLGVALLLDLGLERKDNAFRLHVTLHRAGTSDPVWTGTYAGDVLTTQRAVLAGLPQLLTRGGFTGRFSDADLTRLVRMPTASATALQDYFEGQSLLARTAINSAEGAIAAFQRSLQEDPGFVMAMTSLSEAYSLRYQETRDAAWLEKATQSAQQALSLDATDASAHVSLARVKHQTGHLGEAIHELRLAVQLVPDSDDAHRSLGRFLAESGNSKEGVLELERAISLRPSFWSNHYTLGYVRYMEGRYDDAIPSFVRVTELQPNYADGYVILGASYQRAGLIDLAIGNYEHAARIGPSANAYANLGSIYYVDRRFSAALTSYRAALDNEPSSPDLWRGIGDAYAKLDRRDDAIASYERAIVLSEKELAVNPRNASALASLALCEAKVGRRANAERRAAEALALAQHDREVLFMRAATYAVLKQQEKALAALRSALTNGYEPALARDDADLDVLRTLPEFRSLVGQRPNRAPH